MSNAALATVPLSVLICLGSVVDGSAQNSTTRGWLLGLDAGVAATRFDDASRDMGGIVGLRLGYGVSQIVTPYLGIYEADADVRGLDGFDEVTLGYLDLGLRLHFANSERRWVPYGDVAISVWPVSGVHENGEQTTTDFTSVPSLTIGGGLANYLSRSWVIDVNFKWGSGYFKDVQVGNISASKTADHVHIFRDMNADTTRLTVGVSWWP